MSLFNDIVQTSRAIAGTTKRLEKTERLSVLLTQIRPEEVETVVAVLSGQARQGRIGIGYATIREASAPPAMTPTLAVSDVDQALENLASVRGPGSEERRRELLNRLLSQATGDEQDFLVRLLMGELRQGALEGIMFDALARSTNISGERIRRAAMMGGGAAAIARAVIEHGEAGLEQFDVQLFRPIQPMLAQTADDVAEAIDELDEPALEYKFDGARVQVHKDGERVAVYSRQMNDVSAAVPEVVEAVRVLPANNLILDGEVLALDNSGRALPFQITMRRFGRKLDVESMRRELPMHPFWFDVIYRDGQSLIDAPQSERFGLLKSLAPMQNIVPHIVTGDADAAEDFLRAALDAGNEGVMAKSRQARYAAGARGQSWLKVKRARTLDLVILAAEWGNGRRQGWLSNLHLGARDTIKGGFAMLGKTFKGLTDEMLAWQTEALQKIAVSRDRWAVYVEPKIVVEIAFNEIQVSLRYQSGLALRFARVKRYRPDKDAEESDTFQTVQKLAGMTA